MERPRLADPITLIGGAVEEGPQPGRSSALILKVDEQTLQQFQRASREKDGLRFTTGSTPVSVPNV
jgi:hypothetical protein